MNWENKTAYIDVGEEKARIEKNDLLGPIDFGVEAHLEDYKSFGKSASDEDNALCFGRGKLAPSTLPGTKRLNFVAKSPLWGSLFISSMGGAGLPFYHTGLDFASIEGKAEEPTIIKVKGVKEETKVEFESIDKSMVLSVFESYEGKRGSYALEKFIFDNFKDFFKEGGSYLPFRIITVGPAAMNTDFGCLRSSVIPERPLPIEELEIEPELSPVDDFAGRGGMGSVLYQAHNVVGIIYGGSYLGNPFKTDLRDTEELKRIFKDVYGEDMNKKINSATEKYRYNPEVESGGTFGVNMSTLGSWLIMFNWKNIYWDEEKRKEFYQENVKEHYLKQFNKEIIEPRNFKTCGEVCPAVCKKVYKQYKKDYEPYTSQGTQCGIFDQRAAEKVVKLNDALGMDAIEFGNIASFLLEALEKGLLKKEDLRLEKEPSFDPETWELEDSEKNSEIVRKIAKRIAYGEGIYQLLGSGLRNGTKELNERFDNRVADMGTSFVDLAVYCPAGKQSSIVPAQYWVPGFFIPLLIQGTFMTEYHSPFHSPKEFGKISAERAVKEMYSENLALCRFHRGWSEGIVQELLKRGYGYQGDLYKHSKALWQKFWRYSKKAKNYPAFWESERVYDLVKMYLEKLNKKSDEEGLEEWTRKFKEDKMEAAKEYWLKVLRGIEEKLDVDWEKFLGA